MELICTYQAFKRVRTINLHRISTYYNRDVLYQDPMGTYNPQPLRNLTHYMPYIDVPTYVSSFAPRNFPNRVIVTYPSYPRDLEQLLATTTPEVVQAYFVTRAALDLSGNLGPNTEPWKISRELVEVLNGLKKGAVPDRSEWCLSRVEEALGFASGRFYVKELFSSRCRVSSETFLEPHEYITADRQRAR